MQHSLESDPQYGEMEPGIISTIVSALEAFASAETLEETLNALKEQQEVLLLAETLKTIYMMIDEMFANGQNSDARNWRQYLHLLEETKHHGIERAWHYFMARQKRAVEALERLTTADNDDALYQRFIDNEESLISDAALVMLDNNIQCQFDTAPQAVVRNWQQLLQLLEDAQERGMTEAWQSFRKQ